MDYGAHAYKKRIVEYDSSNFDWQKEKLEKFIRENTKQSYFNDDFWEIKVEEMENVVRLMKINHKPEDRVVANYTAKEAMDIFQGWIDMVKNNPENYSNPEWITIEWY